MSTNQTADDGNEQPTITRRRSLQLAAAAGAAATIGASPASARTGDGIGGLDYSSDLAPDPEILMELTVAEHEGGTGDLSFTDDSGDNRSLKSEGFVLQTADRSSDPPEPMNPISLKASDIKAEEFDLFPRGETFEDADGDEQDLYWYESQHWSVSGLSLGEGDNNSLTLSGSSSGDSAELSDVEITSGVDRKVLQLVVDLSSGSLDVEIEDSSGSVATHTISSTGTSKIEQTRVGDLSTSLDDIQIVRFVDSSGGVDAKVFALNLDRESEWEFGTEQYVDSDDELDEQDVDPSEGTFSITSLDTLPSYLRDAPIEGKQLKVKQVARELPAEDVWIRAPELPDVSSYDRNLQIYYQFTTPSVYDVEGVSRSSVEYETGWPDDRYDSFGTAASTSRIDLDDEPDWEDDVESKSYTDQTGSLGSSGDESTLITGPSDTGTIAMLIEIPLSTDRLSDIEDSSMGGAVAAGEGGGILGWISSNPLLSGLGVAVVALRKRILGVLGS